MQDMATLRPDRIRERLAALGMSPREASLRATRSPDLVRFIFSGKQANTTHERTLSLAAVLQCSVEYLTGEGDAVGRPPRAKTYELDISGARIRGPARPRPTSRDVAPSPAHGRTARVLEYDIKLSAGGGSLITNEQPRDEWGVPFAFLESMRLDARHLAIVSIIGESMEPLLRDGDIVMLDLRSRNPSLPGIYALWEGSATVCKRVEIVHGTDPPKLRVMSVNPAYSTYEVLAEETNIIGRVAWFGRRT